MAAEIIPGSVPAPDHPAPEPFAAHALAALNGPPPEIDPALQSAKCYERAHELLTLARDAREIGTRRQVRTFVKAAMMLRFAGHRWRDRARDTARMLAQLENDDTFGQLCEELQAKKALP